MKNALLLCSLLGFVILSTGCPRQPATAPGESPEGYALLYNVASQEQDVDKLLWIKEPGPEISAWVKEIATFNKEVATQLQAWKKDGSVENLDNLALPPAEMKARARAASQTTGDLLFDTDTDLRVVMIYSQLQSLGYCSDLCYAIAELPYGKPHADTLHEWEKRYHEIQDTGFKMLKTGAITAATASSKDATSTDSSSTKSNTGSTHGPSQN
ncbi:hypothetical protein H5P28_07595 [Ruficoccus amylovorans]|uniref:Lipoprotein n=1 Tax=Ruficoccus amylovorans TaxID=1804625 RepID=A0A842HCB1_9BACT|nr:hypothetical protein [Ruficoccus amylovorans]MBC2594125.1 hypothetical protein [Ruficoccus amylovorans]